MDDKEFYLDAIRDVVPEHKEEQIQDVFYLKFVVKYIHNSLMKLQIRSF